MKRLLTLAFLLVVPLLSPAEAAAQQFERVTPIRLEDTATARPAAPAAAARPAAEEPVPHSGTHILMQRPENQEALQRYHARRADGFGAVLRAERAAVAVGQRTSFRVWNFEEEEYEDVDFTLKRTTDRFYLWVQTSELGTSRVRDQDVDSLKRALYDVTPEGSINPDRGIIVNDEEIFGNPPDVDGDGRTDVLLVDIQDGYDGGENSGYTAGFVTSADLTGSGNNRDILYLDTMPGIYSGSDDSLRYRPYDGVAATAAHEYQHLIRFAYDANELTFVDEGLSEYAEVLNGYPLRTPQYLGDVETYNVSLLSWSDDSFDRLYDYQRAALFTLYLGNRLGYEAVGELTRLTTVGYFTYANAIEEAGLTFEDLMADFHTANFLNATSVREELGYPRYDGRFGAEPSVEVDGRTAKESPNDVAVLERGGVQYLTWTDVRDFRLFVDAVTTERREWLRARALLYRGQSVEVRDVALQAEPHLFEGEFDRVVLVLAHANANKSQTHVRYSALWSADEVYAVTDVAYDDGAIAVDGAGGLMYLLLGDEELLTHFEQPEGAELTRIRLPLYFYSQFGNDDAPSEDAPRDFTLVIRAAGADGQPGEELYRQVLDHPKPYRPLTNDIASTVQFTELDVDELPTPLPDLPETFFIGFTNAGTDANEIVFAPSNYGDRNVSFIGPTSQGTFRALWDVTLSDETETSLEGMSIPIRAEFLAPKGAPEALTLSTYPNPVSRLSNPYPRVRFELPRPMHVRITVYDMLGRQVATVVEGEQPAEEIVAPFSIDGLASGVYFVVLETDEGMTTKKLVVL